MAAGGMGGRRGIPFGNRVRVEVPPGSLDPVPAEPQPARRRHCWVRLIDHEDEDEGLVYQCSRGSDDWLALVIYILDQPTGATAVAFCTAGPASARSISSRSV